MRRLLLALLVCLCVPATGQPALGGPELQDAARASAALRQLALNRKFEDLGLSPQAYPHEVWGVMMETGFSSGGFFSLVVLAGGTTSIYVSRGGGVIGTGEKPEVLRPSEAMLAEANRVKSKAGPAMTTPPPQAGQVIFYLLSRNGVYAYRASADALAQSGDPLSVLFLLGHEVIAAVSRASGADRASK